MAYINGNKPIVTNGLVYALDFGNTKSYVSGSNRAVSLAYDPAVTIVTGSTAIPTLSATGLTFSGSQFIQRSASLSALDPNGTFTICAVVKANTSGTLFTQNSSVGNLSGRFQSTSSLSTGFTLSSGDFSRIYTGNFTGSQHVTYRYNSGSFDTFINGIPVTASQANTALTGSGLTSTLFINSGSLPFSGSLSSFYVYNRALTADEVYQNFEIASTRYGLPYRPKPYTIDENLYQFLQTTGITDTVTTNALSTFISGLKSNGLWNKMVAIYPFVSNTTASLTTNLKEPGLYRLGLTGSFSASSAGLTPSSSTAFIDTIPGNTAYASVNSQSAHLTLLSYDLPTGNGFLAGNSARAVGGDLIVSSGSRMYHVYRNVGTSSFVMGDHAITNVEVLVAAGGGSGGQGGYPGGGGGAGGLIYSSSFSLTPGSNIEVIVGEGGVPNSNGKNSKFSTIEALGGGRGGVDRSGAGQNGGSGGGGASNYPTDVPGGLTPSGSGTPGQGNNGAYGLSVYSNTEAGGIPTGGGGGGGAGSAGFTGSQSPLKAGDGGSGSYFAQYAGINLGSPAGWFAGGGGGGYYGTPAGGNSKGGFGGGGTGSSNLSGILLDVSNGRPNTGGGGGGSAYFALAGSGGSGIVIVSYNLPASALTGSGTGLYLTETSITGSVNSQFTSGITGSGNIGLLTVSRTQPAIFSIHKNNISQSVASASLGALPTDIFFNTANLAGSSSLPLQSAVSFASIGSGLTTTEVATYHNLIGQLQANLKRQNTLLDNYSGAAAAYSLRRIGPSNYFGPAIRVRRDSDNTLRDIGFTSDGQLDTVGLLDFVGVTGSGFVNTWYDQSGNSYDLTQGTTTSQPLILVSGSVYTDTNKPAVYFDGGDSLVSPSTTQTMDYLSAYILARPLTDPAFGYGWWRIGTTNQSGYKTFLGYNNDINTFYYSKGGDTSYTLNFIIAGKKQLLTVDADSTGFNFYDNNTLSQTLTRSGILSGGTQIRLGTSIYGTSPVIFQENIIYPESKRNTILSDVNNNILSAYTTGSDPDYQSFITATGITQPTQSAALETLVSDLKSYGLWNKMKAIYPMITDKNNRFAYSQALATTWNAVNVYVTQSFITAPDGTLTGNFVSESAATDSHYIYQTIADGLTTGSEYVASIHARFLNRPWIAMETNTGAKAWFNIQTGITGSLTGSNATITAVSGGWYRCALYFTSSVASGPQNIQYNLADANGNLSYAGVAGTGSYLWGAQFENGNVLGPYRATTATGFTTGSMLDQMKYNLKNTGSFSGSYFGGLNPGYSGNKPDGVTGYMNTGLNISSSLLLNSTHLSYYSRTATTGLQSEIGAYSSVGTVGTFLAYNYGGGDYKGLNAISTILGSAFTPSTGLLIGSRVDAAGEKYYFKGSLVNTITLASNTRINATIFLGAHNINGSAGNFSAKEWAFATIGDGLTDYEAKALYWIVQKYQTTLGRQVY
jgi:hypothetical protein